MDWKLSQDTETVRKKELGAPIISEYEKSLKGFGTSERNVPTTEFDNTTDPIGIAEPNERLNDYEKDLKLALNGHQMLFSQRSKQKNQLFVKIWDRRLERLNLEYFPPEHNVGNSKVDAHFQTLIKQYFRRYPHAISENIWFSQETQNVFSNAQTYDTGYDPIAHSFCTNKTNFINQTWNGLASEMGRMIEDLASCYNGLGLRPNAWGVTAEDINSGKCYGDIVMPDIRFGLCPSVNNLANQDSVLIVGGGPSTNKIDFSKYKDIPVWTMNNYYQNPIFDQFSNIQAACFLDEVDVFDNEKLWKYVNDRNTLVFQEITDFGVKRIDHIKNMANHSTYFHTRYRSKLGVGPRMLITAILFGIRNIYFCGFDGYSVDTEDNHAFEKNKAVPNWMKNSPNPSAVQREQYVMLWDYIFNHLKLKRTFRMCDLAKENKDCEVEYEFLQDFIR